MSGFSLYTQISFCFPVALSDQHNHIIQAVEQGLEKLTDAFPWCAGKVVGEEAGPGRSPVFKIKQHLPAPSLVVKDLTNDPCAPTMESLRAARFPFKLLDENIIAPRNTLPGTSDEPISDAFPVFIVQANFIVGGLILTINAAHNVVDMVGQGQLMKLLSKACRGEPFTPADLKSGVLDIKVPTLDDLSGARTMVEHQIRKRADPAPAPPGAAVWAYFDFTHVSLEALKARALETLPASASFISIDDALSAFIWQAIARARLPRFSGSQTTPPPPPPSTTLGRAVDVRSALGISATYMAIMQNMVYSTFPSLSALASVPLGDVAARLRHALDPDEMKRNTYALATRTPGWRWTSVQCYDLDFGLGLGEAECVRRPQFVPVEGLMYLLPRTREGDIALAVCLRKEDMQRLADDDEFGRFGKYIP